MEKLLLNENKKMADSYLNEMNQVAQNLTDIIHEFNQLPLLDLKIGKEVFDFLSNPLDYFDSRIIIETDISISKNIKINPGQLAKLCNIPYSNFVNRIGLARFVHLNYFVWDEKRKVLEVNPDKIESVRESFRQYSESEKETKEILEVRKLTKLLNQHVKKFNLQDDLDRTAHILNIKLIPNPDERGYIFVEDILFIRERILIEQI